MAFFIEHPAYSQEFLNGLLHMAGEQDLLAFDRVCPFDLEDTFLDYACRVGNLNLVHWRFETRTQNRPDQAYFFLLALCHDHHDIADYICSVYRGVNPSEFSMFACTTLICSLVEDNNIEAIKKVIDAGFILQNNDAATFETMSHVTTRAMIRLLHLQARADLNAFQGYFREHFLIRGHYEVVEYLGENGISVNTIDTTTMDDQLLQIYHEALINYMRWVDLKTRALARVQRKIFFKVFPKIYSNQAFVMEQAGRSYDRLMGEQMA
jgi:hypothetical protein